MTCIKSPGDVEPSEDTSQDRVPVFFDVCDCIFPADFVTHLSCLVSVSGV